MNGSINDSRDWWVFHSHVFDANYRSVINRNPFSALSNDCEDDDEVNGDIDDITEDLNDNYKMSNITDPYQYQWHRATSNNNSIRNNSSEMANYSRSVMK